MTPQELLDQEGFIVLAANSHAAMDQFRKTPLIDTRSVNHQGVLEDGIVLVVIGEATQQDWERQRVLVGNGPNSGCKHFGFVKTVAE